MARAFSRAFAKAGSSMAAKMAIIAMTTNNSISVNASFFMIGFSMFGGGELGTIVIWDSIQKLCPINKRRRVIYGLFPASSAK